MEGLILLSIVALLSDQLGWELFPDTPDNRHFRNVCLDPRFAGRAESVLEAWRNEAPTVDGLILFPLESDGLIAQNKVHWLLGRCYGLPKAYDALEEASRHLREAYPGSVVSFMDVNGRHKEQLSKHHSHQEGVDVDVLFFGSMPDGQYVPSETSLVIEGYLLDYETDGKCGELTFDAARNWRFIEGVLMNRSLEVEKIFVEPYIKEWLIKEGEKQGATDDILRWADEVLQYAGDYSEDHKDHFHIRFRKE